MLRHNKSLYRIIGIILIALLLVLHTPSSRLQAQDNSSDSLRVTIQAGYGGLYRPNWWLPVRISVENLGSDIAGRFVVRPETSGSGIPNMFSVPVTLLANNSQSFFLYIVARGNVSSLRVELLDEEERVLFSQNDVRLSPLQPRDRLHAVITDAAYSPIRLSGLHVGGYSSRQTDWDIEDIPDRVAALESIDLLLFNNVDTGTLIPEQRRAIRTWVLGGGHLIVTGGPDWESTAAGLTDLLPLVPSGNQTSTDMAALVRLAGDNQTTLTGQFVVAIGDLIAGAQVLAADGAGNPLVVRRSYGNGTVDYLAVDPSRQPLRDWDELASFWFNLATSVAPTPSWSQGFSDWRQATIASEILPGINLLPAALGLTGFLLAYIVLVGPVNYFLLSRLNRREYAWFTIPLLIVVFTVAAWTLGFEIRGNRVMLSRVSVVQTWTDAEEAQLNQVIGLLAPRRGDYTLSMPDERLLRPISEDVTYAHTPNSNSLTGVDIQQTDHFAAVDFPVDASFMSAFYAAGIVEKPAIGGRVTLGYAANGEIQTLQGSVSNDSDLTLADVVILAQGRVFRLDESFGPGATIPFDLDHFTVTAMPGALPCPLEYAIGTDTPFVGTNTLGFRGIISAYAAQGMLSVSDVLAPENYQSSNFGVLASDDERTKELRRRQAFLSAFMVDQFTSTARGGRVYLVGWTDTAPTVEDVPGHEYDAIDSTLYIIELEVEQEPPPSGEVNLLADRFTWVSLERTGVSDMGPVSTMFYADVALTFQFTPLPEALLSDVTSLTIIIDRSRNVRAGGQFQLWNWQTASWELIELPILTEQDSNSILNPARFIGPQNAVRVRLTETDLGRSMFIRLVAVEQQGRY